MAMKNQSLEGTGLHLTQLPGGQIGWSVNHQTAERGQRFASLQQQVLLPQEPSAALLAARMVTLDAVPPEAMLLIEQQGSRPYRITEGVAIEWIAAEPVRIERRLLSPMTLLAWPSTMSPVQCGAVNGLAVGLSEWVSRQDNYAEVKTPLETLAGDQLCWLQAVVPGPILGHLSHMATLSALPRNAWARLLIRKPLQLDAVKDNPDVGAAGALVQATLDTEGDTHNSSVIRMAEDVFRQAPKVQIDGHIKRSWAQSLASLEARLRRAHPSVGLVVAWAAHMCESGTLDSGNPAARTVKKYALRGMWPLSQQLSGLPDDIDRWTADRLGSIYISLMEQTTPNSRGEMSAALGSFHAFLQEWFDVPPVVRHQGDWTPGKPAVSANLIWDHELRLCIDLCGHCDDPRLGRMAAVCFWIARENPVRIQDLLRLRLCNLHLYEDDRGTVIEIEVARDAGRGRLKTEDSQRRLFVRGAEGIDQILAWLEQRRKEAAPADALLFGEKGNDRKVYRRAALHSYVNALVKSVTGDVSLRFHHLRHSRISAELNAILCSIGFTDVNRLEMLAGDAGHASPFTTIRVYSHLYESALRLWLDLALREQCKLTALQAQAWLNEKPNTLVQAARRRGLSMFELVWSRLAQRIEGLPIESVDADFQWSAVIPPTVAKPARTGVSPAVLGDALLRLAKGESSQTVAELVDIAPHLIEQWVNRVTAWLKEVARTLHPRKLRLLDNASPSELMMMVGADTDRMFNHRLAGLEEYLAGEPDRQLMEQAVQGWLACGRGEHIALGHGLPARGVLRLLRSSGLAPAAVRLVQQSADSAPSDAARLNLHAAVRLYQEEFGCQPIIEIRAPRVDRPDVYLLITSQPRMPVTASAASCNAVLKAWLVACQAFLLFTTKEDRNEEPA